MAATPAALSPQQQLRAPSAGTPVGSRRRGGGGLAVRCQGSNGQTASATDGNGSGSSGASYALSTSNGTGARKSRPNSEKPTGVGSDTGSGWKAP
jgi:hypothetical protein